MEGTRLGPYQVTAELGSGGMGKVYRAELTRQAAGLDAATTVAIKVIHAHLLEQEGFFQRFLREADIGRSVQHENVVRTYVADALMLDGAQQNFLVMEYVEGQTLRDLVDELDRVPEELCRHIGREVARGLSAIHEAGVVHRDVKPENVLITEEHVVKVMDLGVARLQDEAIRLSQAGAFVGSLEYAAPEQFRSVDGEPDGRADLHALGVVLYELATGQHPYRDEDVSRVIHNLLHEHPRKAGEVNPQLSPFFEELVHTLLAKDRGERFQSATELAAVLEEGEKHTWWQDRAKALRLETKRPLRRIRIPRETALYGRDDDLARLQAAFEKAGEGDGQVLLIEGEAGIGKSRLVDEFVGRLRQQGEDVNFLFGSYPPGGAATAAGAFSEAYREQFGAEGLEETLQDYLTPTPILVPAFAAILRGETTPKDAERLTKDSLQTVFVHATRGLAAERTTIVLIDDLHFAPEEGRALFASLALAVPGHRILLLGTMRPGVSEDWTANVERLDHAGRMSLARLRPKDLFSLLKDSFRSDRLAHELGMQISVKSDGNPFFAFEIIRGLREGQFITQQHDGTWVTTRIIEDIHVPSSVLDLVNARIADLSEEERELLDVAACCGFEFEAGTVADAIGVPRIPALRRLGQIERKHRLVRTAGRSCVFDHHQVQEALYGSLMPELREEYHAAIAKALEARAGAAGKAPKDLDGALCVDLCDHYLEGAQGEKALHYMDAGLDHLEAGYLSEQAVALCDRALDTPNLLTGGRRLDLLLRKNTHLNLLGRRDAQKEALAEARTLAEETGETATLMNVERATGLLRLYTGSPKEAEGQFERCLEFARALGDRASEAGGMVNLGIALYDQGRHEEARSLFEQGLALSREIGHRSFEGNAIGNLGLVLQTLGRSEEALAYFRRALQLCREVGNRSGESASWNNLGYVLRCLGRTEEALTHHERALEIGREVGHRRAEGSASANAGLALYHVGRSTEALEHLERALQILREVGDGTAPGTMVDLGTLLCSLGRTEEAAAHCERALSVACEIGDRRTEGYALWRLSSLAEQSHLADRALDLAGKALALRRENGDLKEVSDSLLQLGEFHLRKERVDEAREALDEATDLLRQQDRKLELAHALALLANLPHGDADAAEAALHESAEARNTPQTRYYLWRATRNPEHLAEAKRLLDYRVQHAPAEYRESMLEKVRLHREIMEAWAERGSAEA